MEIGILLHNYVPASMKNAMYKTSAAFTLTKIISCKCSCGCGAEGDESLVDVHVLPLGLELSFY